eukprot:2247800-Alexandrium_andersonii.AAC.1
MTHRGPRMPLSASVTPSLPKTKTIPVAKAWTRNPTHWGRVSRARASCNAGTGARGLLPRH